jgi:subtilisin family serine protease
MQLLLLAVCCCCTLCSDGKYTTTSERGADGSPLTPVSGTSFAAPYTAGALALALQLHRQNIQNPEAQGIAALQGLPAEEREKGFVQRFVNDALVRGALQLDTFGMNTTESTSKQGGGECSVTHKQNPPL